MHIQYVFNKHTIQTVYILVKTSSTSVVKFSRIKQKTSVSFCQGFCVYIHISLNKIAAIEISTVIFF